MEYENITNGESVISDLDLKKIDLSKIPDYKKKEVIAHIVLKLQEIKNILQKL